MAVGIAAVRLCEVIQHWNVFAGFCDADAESHHVRPWGLHYRIILAEFFIEARPEELRQVGGIILVQILG